MFGMIVARESSSSCSHHKIVSVPTSLLPQLVYETKKDMAQHGIKSTIVGHVGDGKLVTQM